MSLEDDLTKKAILYRMHTPQHLCPFGLKSRDLLRRNGYEIDDHKLTSRDETDAFKREHGVETTPQTFIDGKRIGGYTELRKFFGKSVKNKNTLSYTPILAIFSMTMLMAGALTWSGGVGESAVWVLETFVALSMCVLAIQKLRDLDAFSLQFITYDLIAMRYVRYAYAYVFLEAFSGVAMLARLPAWLAGTPAIFIGAVGAASVIKAVYIDQRELKCACVGGNSNVPLGAVSLSENLLMLLMGVWMWVQYI